MCVFMKCIYLSNVFETSVVMLDLLHGLLLLSCIVASVEESFPQLISEVNLQSLNHYLFIMASVRSHH